MKKVFISGCTGNMGRRYTAICHDLGLTVMGGDKETPLSEQASVAREKDCDGVIIATPTVNHVDALNLFGNIAQLPILCEKPLAPGKLLEMRFNVRMVNQYEYMIDKKSVGKTYWNYYKSGDDGLLWDCINIIGLAKSECVIKGSSPFWRCMINGKELNIKDMDMAYFDMVKDWVKNPTDNLEYCKMAHDKVEVMVDKMIKKNLKKNEKHKKSKLNCKTNVVPILG